MTSPSLPTSDARLSVGIVVLTMGNRPNDVKALVESLNDQPADEQIIVGNGAEVHAPHGWHVVTTPQNLGVPGGRSFGLRNTTSDILLFIDDDAVVRSPDLVERTRSHFSDNPRLGALALRIVETGTDESSRRWSPRLTTSLPDGVTEVPTFPGGGNALRRTAYLEVGGYVDEFFFKHEETELSWKLIDAGWSVAFDPDAVIEHPASAENRQANSLQHGVRNKTWLARLRLPFPAQWLTIAISLVRTILRARSKEHLTAIAAGLKEGMGALPQERAPISWKTMARLTRLGRPPIL